MQARASASVVLRSRAMEDFLDDIGAEVEVNPDEVEVVKKKKPKKTRLLRKDEKKALYCLACFRAGSPVIWP